VSCLRTSATRLPIKKLSFFNVFVWLSIHLVILCNFLYLGLFICEILFENDMLFGDIDYILIAIKLFKHGSYCCFAMVFQFLYFCDAFLHKLQCQIQKGWGIAIGISYGDDIFIAIRVGLLIAWKICDFKPSWNNQSVQPFNHGIMTYGTICSKRELDCRNWKKNYNLKKLRTDKPYKPKRVYTQKIWRRRTHRKYGGEAQTRTLLQQLVEKKKSDFH
jgi:hypothetical protein